jgi:hypothetical protein
MPTLLALGNTGVALRFQLQRQRLVAAFDDAAIGQHVHKVRHHVIEQALVVGDHQERALGRAQRVHALRHLLQRVDIETRIGLVEDRQLRLEYGHLKDLVALFFAAGETFVDRAMQQFVRDLHHLELLAHQLEKLHGVQLLFTAHLALRIERGAQKVGVIDAGNFHRVLKRQKHAGRRALFRIQREQVDAVVDHRAGGDFVTVAAGEHVAQGRFAGAVRPHDGVDFARIHGKAEALENFLALNADVQVFDCQHAHYFDPTTAMEHTPRPCNCW